MRLLQIIYTDNTLHNLYIYKLLYIFTLSMLSIHLETVQTLQYPFAAKNPTHASLLEQEGLAGAGKWGRTICPGREEGKPVSRGGSGTWVREGFRKGEVKIWLFGERGRVPFSHSVA